LIAGWEVWRGQEAFWQRGATTKESSDQRR
jgi:hypothetical protein